MEHLRRRDALALLIAGGAIGLAGCAPERTIAATPTPSATPTPTPTPVAMALSPLRGIEVEAAKITGPALAAKIDNHWDARPQWGLQHTDIVFEELVEGGITRYVAVWFSKVPKEIGPVRSIRPMDPDIISPLGGIVAYSGGRAQFVQMMRDTRVHNAIHGGADDRFMYRTNAKYPPHNVIVKARSIRKEYASIKPPVQQFEFTSLPAAASAAAYGRPVKRINLTFSPGSVRNWVWHPKTATYLRSQDGRKDLDNDGDQLRATNVIAMVVPIDWRYGYIPKTVMIGSGRAFISTGGKTLRAKWIKKKRNDPVTFLNRFGMPIRLAPGNTWVELVPKGFGQIEHIAS